MEQAALTPPSVSASASRLGADADPMIAILPMSERPFASLVDSTLRPDTDKSTVHSLMDAFKRRVLSAVPHRGCLYNHLLEEIEQTVTVEVDVLWAASRFVVPASAEAEAEQAGPGERQAL
jgi:hypothetical protein